MNEKQSYQCARRTVRKATRWFAKSFRIGGYESFPPGAVGADPGWSFSVRSYRPRRNRLNLAEVICLSRQFVQALTSSLGAVGCRLRRLCRNASSKRRESCQRFVDIRFRMVGRNLETDLFVTTWHDREVQAGGQNPLFSQMTNQFGRPSCIPHHQRHNRMITDDCLETEFGQSLLETLGHFTQVVEQRLPPRAAQKV